MRTEQKRDVKKYFFLLPNAVFELGLHVYELAIYAYLLRIEDRRTWQCVVSYPAIADKLGISVNTVENQMVTALKKLRVALKDYLPLLLFLVN